MFVKLSLFPFSVDNNVSILGSFKGLSLSKKSFSVLKLNDWINYINALHNIGFVSSCPPLMLFIKRLYSPAALAVPPAYILAFKKLDLNTVFLA